PARFREQIGHRSRHPRRVAVRSHSPLRTDRLVLEQGDAAVRGRGVEGQQAQGVSGGGPGALPGSSLYSSSPVAAPPVAQTPAMQQYHRMKAEPPDALLLFSMGDFYELFFEDAVVAAPALEIALTSRSRDKDGQAIPMCGVPYHAASSYIARLVRQGFR